MVEPEPTPKRMPPWKRLAFVLVLWMPTLIVSFLVIWIVVDLVRLNAVRHAEIGQAVEAYLEQKRPIPMPWPKQLERVGPHHKRVYLFGASSVVLSDGATFNQPLEGRLTRELNPNIRLINFGYCGVDSHAIRKAALKSMEDGALLPDLLLFYMGHNDYANAYHHVISASYDFFIPLQAVAWLFSGRDCDFEAYLRQVTPELMESLQETGLVEIDDQDYGCYDRLILDRFEENLDAILDRAAELAIPVLLVTPVGSLRQRPYGRRSLVTEPWSKGLVENRHDTALALLTQAKDAEILTFDVRAKTQLLEFLRGLNRPGVFVYDLDQAWRRAGRDFGSEDFMDYFHLKASAHKDLADRIFEFIRSRPELLANLDSG
ncbi:MAG: hypothetical protein JRF33_02985 [Deltaproteobacteria bacterium]|nr:hypothetical protein [Deltaproteobacteria bacterium]